MDSKNWLSFDWFSPEILRGFEYEHEWAFYVMASLPIIYLIVQFIKERMSPKIPVALKGDGIDFHFSSLLRFIPVIILLFSAMLMLLALARPQQTNERVEQWTEGIDIMLVLDISESMKIQDFTPDRLAAAKNVAIDFIDGRFQDRIGLVIFSGEAYSLSPLTTDYKMLKQHILDIDFKMIEASGTAIGSALAVGTNRMRESDSKSKVMILLSDGDNNAGNIDPETAANLADAYNIKIYTIAIGKEGKVPYGKDFFGRTRYIENTLDVSGLQNIAKIGNGKFYRATDNQALKEVFDIIDQYEKAEIKETRYKDTNDYYVVYLKWAIIFFLLWLFTKSTFISNVLVD